MSVSFPLSAMKGGCFIQGSEASPAELLAALGSHTERTWSCWREHGAGSRMIREMEQLCCEERLAELAVFSLEKEEFQGHLIAAFQYLKGDDKKDGERLFALAWSDRTRRNWLQTESRLRLDIRKKFFSVRVMRSWNRFPKESVSAPSLELFKVGWSSEQLLQGKVSSHISVFGSK